MVLDLYRFLILATFLTLNDKKNLSEEREREKEREKERGIFLSVEIYEYQNVTRYFIKKLHRAYLFIYLVTV